MASQAGLSRGAAQEFVQRAPTLDGGHFQNLSGDPQQSGPIITAQQLDKLAASGHVRIMPTAAQSGLLQLLQAQDAGAPSGTPNGAAAGLPLVRGSSPGAPGNGAVTPQVAAELLRNMTEGRPPFRPELGKVGPVSWFVTDGNPYTGTGTDKSVAVPVEVSNPGNKPPLRFNEAQMLEIYNSKMAEALALVERQMRAESGLVNGEKLGKDMLRDLKRRAHQVAERAMWTEIGNRTAGSEGGIGKVELKDSKFSRSGNGEFTLTSRAEAVRIKGGAQALLKIIREQGVAAEPAVLEAARKLAASEKWVGRVQGTFRVGGKILIVVGIAADAYKIYTATDKAKAVAQVVAGWTAAGVAGGAFATAFAPADLAGPFAWAVHGVGTLVVGGVAYWVGSTTTRVIYELVIEGKPITIGPE